ncbi:RluA family pseudouridine synthase [Candidatus Dependentiae bacterium]|nr:RluA family pseudouridine synthase [Candidatus Dependentiae bacterium]
MEQGHIQEGTTFQLIVEESTTGQRIDKYIAQHFKQYSRSFLQKLFDQKLVIINKKKLAKPSYIVIPGDQISISFPYIQTETATKNIPQDMNISIVTKEQDFLIINKPTGLVVHAPSIQYQDITLSDWIIHTHAEIAHVGLVDRPGIVHRLDKDTSGLMIIPRTSNAHATFTDMFKNRKIKKTYLAIVLGHPPKTGTIDFYIGRHPIIRNKMHHFTQKTKLSSSRQATTHFQVLEYFKDFSLVKIEPITGRTHQIRVHFTALGYPLLADCLYGSKSKLLQRHALHAHKLEFEYQNKQYSFTSELEQDMQEVINNAQKLELQNMNN